MSDQLIPRQPRRLRQPSKQVLRDQLALAATEIERLRGEVERLSKPWWKRMARMPGIEYRIAGSNPPAPLGNKPPPPPNPPALYQPGVRLLAFTESTDDGDLITREGYRLAYGGTPSCWRVKPEDFPIHPRPTGGY